MNSIDNEKLSLDTSYASDISDGGSATRSTEDLKYKCKYCPQMFAKPQALDGHQNVHMREKEINKRQNGAYLGHLNQTDPDSYPHINLFSNQYALPPKFEQPRFKGNRAYNLTMVYN